MSERYYLVNIESFLSQELVEKVIGTWFLLLNLLNGVFVSILRAQHLHIRFFVIFSSQLRFFLLFFLSKNQ